MPPQDQNHLFFDALTCTKNNQRMSYKTPLRTTNKMAVATQKEYITAHKEKQKQIITQVPRIKVAHRVSLL